MRILILSLCLLLSTALIGQNESSVQKTLITKRTASWCPNCGSWGWDFAKALEDLNNPNSILIRAHYSGDLQSQVSQDITANFGANYQPEFYLNEEIQSVGSSTWESKVDDFNNQISNAASSDSKVKFSGTAFKTDKGVQLNAKAEFLGNANGEFYFAGYVLEDGIINDQSGHGSNAVHNSVLRASFTEDSFGEKVSDESANQGEIFSLNKEIELEGDPIEDRSFKALLVLWKKIGNQFTIENIHSFEVALTSQVQDLFNDHSDIKIYQSSNQLYFDLNNVPKGDLDLEIFNVLGQKLTSKNGFFQNGEKSSSIDVNPFLNNQFILVKLSDKRGKIYTKLVLLNFV